MDKKSKLVDAVIEAASEIDGRKKLTCAQAFELADKFETEIIGIGHICNQHNIRICKCQLGCFR